MFEKKSNPSALVCFKSNLVEVPYNTWWIDSGCIAHVSNTRQGFITTQTISPQNKKFVFMENRVKTPIEAIGTYHLILDIGHHLYFFETLYVPSISQNLIFMSKLDTLGFSFKFGIGCFSLFKHNYFIGSGILSDGLCKMNLDNLFAETLLILYHNVGTKRGLVKEHLAYLWHKWLGHIFKERLAKNEILSYLDFTDLNICVDCIKGKQTKHTKKRATRST